MLILIGLLLASIVLSPFVVIWLGPPNGTHNNTPNLT